MKTQLTKLVMFCGLTLAAFGQTVNVTDNSPAGSPFVITGTLTFGTDDSVGCAIVGHNRSAKPLLTAKTHLELVSASGDAYSYEAFFQHDHFLKDALAAPNSDFEILSDCNIWDSAEIAQYTATMTPKVRATAIFAQLADGTTWGDSKTQQAVMADRREMISYLQSLQSTYNAGGTSALLTALAVPQISSAARRRRQHHLQHVLSVSGSNAVAETINSYLASAANHQSALLP